MCLTFDACIEKLGLLKREIKARQSNIDKRNRKYKEEMDEEFQSQSQIIVQALERVERTERLVEGQVSTFRNTMKQEIDEKAKDLDILADTLKGELEK
jgi:hypothetical protein